MQLCPVQVGLSSRMLCFPDLIDSMQKRLQYHQLALLSGSISSLNMEDK